MIEKFMSEITERSGGQVQWEKHWGGSLGNVIEHLPLVSTGAVDVIKLPMAAHPAELPLGGFETAFPFSAPDSVMVVKAERIFQDKYNKEFKEMFERNNILDIFMFGWDPLDVMSSFPVETVEDFKGEVVMVWGHWYPKHFEPISGVMACPAYERYMNMKQGVSRIDCLPLSSQDTVKLYEVAKYHTTVGVGAHSLWRTFVNLDTWNSFSPELQKIFLDVGKEMEYEHPRNHMANQSVIKEKFKKEGVTFIVMSEEEKLKWVNQLPDIPAMWVAEMEERGYTNALQMGRDWLKIMEDVGHEWNREWLK